MMTVEEILEEVGGASKVTITGGEPLFQNLESLVKELSNLNKDITVETNGSYPIFGHNFNVRWVVDFKLPSSGMMEHMNSMAFSNLRKIDVIKFVISDIEDYEYAKMLIKEHPKWIAKKVFSPAVKIKHIYANIWGEFEYTDIVMPKQLSKKIYIVDTEWPRILAEMMIRDKLQDIQLSIQIHKVIWPGIKEER